MEELHWARNINSGVSDSQKFPVSAENGPYGQPVSYLIDNPRMFNVGIDDQTSHASVNLLQMYCVIT